MQIARCTIALIGVLAASPAWAFTVLPSSSMPSVLQFSDPDRALDETASSLRDSVVENNLRASPLAAMGAPRPAAFTMQPVGASFTDGLESATDLGQSQILSPPSTVVIRRR